MIEGVWPHFLVVFPERLFGPFFCVDNGLIFSTLSLFTSSSIVVLVYLRTVHSQWIEWWWFWFYWVGVFDMLDLWLVFKIWSILHSWICVLVVAQWSSYSQWISNVCSFGILRIISQIWIIPVLLDIFHLWFGLLCDALPRIGSDLVSLRWLYFAFVLMV